MSEENIKLDDKLLKVKLDDEDIIKEILRKVGPSCELLGEQIWSTISKLKEKRLSIIKTKGECK